jgi:hypothetical protein
MKKYSSLLNDKYDYIVLPILLRTMKETGSKNEFRPYKFPHFKDKDLNKKVIKICLDSRKSHSTIEDYLTNISYWPKDLYLNFIGRTFQLLFFSRIVNAFVDTGIDKKLSINAGQNRNLYNNVRDYIDNFPVNFNNETYTKEILTALDNLYCLDKKRINESSFLDLRRKFLYRIGMRDIVFLNNQKYEEGFIQPFQIGL